MGVSREEKWRVVSDGFYEWVLRSKVWLCHRFLQLHERRVGLSSSIYFMCVTIRLQRRKFNDTEAIRRIAYVHLPTGQNETLDEGWGIRCSRRERKGHSRWSLLQYTVQQIDLWKHLLSCQKPEFINGRKPEIWAFSVRLHYVLALSIGVK